MSIHIKKSHRGLLHKNLGVAQGEKIPASKLKVKSTDSPAVKKRKIFAQNAKKWHHADGGLIEYDEGGKVYNPKLASSDLNFQSWYKGNTLEGKKGIPYSDKLDYDYYSYYKDALSTGGNPTEHFTDAYKKPNHPTFSNESYYAGNGAKGYWKGNKFVKYADGGITSQTQPVGGKVGSLIGVGTALAQPVINAAIPNRSEEHTSELQSH